MEIKHPNAQLFNKKNIYVLKYHGAKKDKILFN